MGLKADDLMKNKRGKVVSKRANALGKRRYHQVEDWVESVMEAREALHVKGFLAINGKSLQGKALYVKARSACSQTWITGVISGTAVSPCEFVGDEFCFI